MLQQASTDNQMHLNTAHIEQIFQHNIYIIIFKLRDILIMLFKYHFPQTIINLIANFFILSSIRDFLKIQVDIFIMHSDSESVRQTFAFPEQQLPSILGGNSGKSLSRRPRDKKQPQKDQLYFKLKVLKHVGQLVSNLKSSIALFSHDLNERQLSYLQTSGDNPEPQSLLRQNNLIFLFAQSILWVLFWIIIWQSTFEMVFSRLQSSIKISVVAIMVYACYLLIYFNSKHRNQRQQLIIVRSVVVKNYLISRFPQIVPFLISTIIDLIFQPGQDSVLYYFVRMVPITLIPEISILYKNLQNAISSQNKGQIIIMFAKLLGKIILFLHFISLLINTVRNLEFKLGYSQTWAEQYRPGQNFSGGELYLLGWYWGSTILCTVGFGDIIPVNNMQRGLISFLQVFCALIFGYFVNYIGHLIKMQGEKTDIFEANLRKLNRYLSKVKIPGSLKRDARAHFFDREQIVKTYNQQQEQQILGHLNANIKNDILEYSNLQILKASSLSKILNLEILKLITYKMRKLIYAPEQTIYSPDEPYAEKLWIVEKGKIIDKWYSGSGKEGKDIAIYTQGVQQNVLGWINFLKNEVYRLTAKSDTFSILHQITRHDFITIIKENRSNFLKLMETKDNMVLTGRKYVFRCLCCQRLSHSTVDCPKIHFPKRSANFLFGKTQSQSLFGGNDKRIKKSRRKLICNNWKSVFQTHELDPNQSRQVQQYQGESYGTVLSPRKSMRKKPTDHKPRHSVDQVIEIAKKCSMRLIQNQAISSNKRLSSKMDIMSQCNSNKNIITESVPEDYSSRPFDKLLQDEQGYFENGNYVKVLQRIESKFQGRKKRLQM